MISIKKIEEILSECYGIKYMESSDAKVDRVRADCMKECVKLSAKMLYKEIQKEQ